TKSHARAQDLTSGISFSSGVLGAVRIRRTCTVHRLQGSCTVDPAWRCWSHDESVARARKPRTRDRQYRPGMVGWLPCVTQADPGAKAANRVPGETGSGSESNTRVEHAGSVRDRVALRDRRSHLEVTSLTLGDWAIRGLTRE